MNKLAISVLPILLLITSSSHGLRVYKWSDSEGIHYSDRRPPPAAENLWRLRTHSDARRKARKERRIQGWLAYQKTLDGEYTAVENGGVVDQPVRTSGSGFSAGGGGISGGGGSGGGGGTGIGGDGLVAAAAVSDEIGSTPASESGLGEATVGSVGSSNTSSSSSSGGGQSTTDGEQVAVSSGANESAGDTLGTEDEKELNPPARPESGSEGAGSTSEPVEVATVETLITTNNEPPAPEPQKEPEPEEVAQVETIEVSGSGVITDPEPAPTTGNSPSSEETFVYMDFEDSVLHTRAWIATQPEGTIAPTIVCKSDSGCNSMSLDVGGGRNGGNALLVTSNSASQGLPGFWIIKQITKNGTWDHVEDNDIYALPRGMRANRLEFWLRFDAGFRANDSSTPCDPSECYPYHQNFHVGTYHFDPSEFPTGPDGEYESRNWHFYYQMWLRHDKAGDDWIHVVLNQLPQHQRDVGPVGNNPTAPIGNFWELLTRIYFDPVGYFDDPEISYPVKMWVDDVALTYVDETELTPPYPGGGQPAVSFSDPNVEKRWMSSQGPFDANVQ